MKKSKKPKRLFTLDTETRGLFGEVFRVGMYDGEQYHVSNDFNEIMEKLKGYEETDNHIYVHNLDFDVAKISPVLFNEAEINFDKSIFINGSVASLHTEYFILHDSYKLLPSSLDKLCKDFQLEDDGKYDLTEYVKEQGYAIYDEAGEYDKEKSLGNFFQTVPAGDEVLNHYLQKDCTSLYSLIMKVCDLSLIEFDVLVYCPTTPSLAMNVFKTQFNEDYKMSVMTKYYGEWGEFLEDFIRVSYCGGRTEVFTPYLKDGFHYDINSLYPYVMKMFKFPVGIPEFMKASNATKIYKLWKVTQAGGGFLHCKVFVPDMYIPPLPKHDYSGKLLFPVGNLEGVWTFIELYEAEKMGCKIIEIEQGLFFPQMENIFEAFVSHFEAIKINSEGALREFAKLVQNTLYGKYGMARQRTTFSNIEKLEEIKKKCEENGEGYTIHRHTKNLVDVSFIEHLFKSHAEYIQPQIASYVTSYARIVLLRGLLKQHDKGVVGYCDTDSIAGNSKMDDIDVDNVKYGKFKLESIIEEGIFLQPKFYAEKGLVEKKGTWEYKETLKAKGIPRSIMKKHDFSSYQNWLDVIKSGVNGEIQIYDNVLNRRKFLSSLKNDEDFDRPVVLKKTINLMLEQKRDIDYINNVSKPHTRNDFGDNVDESRKEIFEKYKDLLFNYYDDVDILKKHIKKFGYLKKINEGENFYNAYCKISGKVIAKYFRTNGVNIVDWCIKSGWIVSELLNELEDKSND